MSRDQSAPPPDCLAGKVPIAVLSPHPDDESLACGALLAQAFAGAGALVICLTDGSASHPGSTRWPGPRLAALRRTELARAIAILGGGPADLVWIGLPDGGLNRVDPVPVALDLAAKIAARDIRHVFAPAPEDHHADHKATLRIAADLRAHRQDWCFYNYPVWSRWDDPDFDRNVACRDPYFVAPGHWRAQKRAAIAVHRTQSGMVVDDDPDGFVLPADMVAKFMDEDEIFWRMA